MSVTLEYVGSGGAVTGGAAWVGDTYRVEWEIGGPAFMLGDLLLAQRIDFNKDASTILVFRVIARVVRIDRDGEAFISIIEGAEFVQDFHEGMEFVRIGNELDEDRQGSVYITSDEDEGPYLRVIDGIDSPDKLGTLETIKTQIGRLTGIRDTDLGDPLDDYYLEGYGAYIPNLYMKGKAVLAAGSTIAWAGVQGAGKPADNATVGATWGEDLEGIPGDLAYLDDIPTLPGYIESTKITATTIESPTITSNASLTGVMIASNGGGNTAGMTGEGSGDDAVRIWAGDVYVDRDAASFRVTQGGKTYIEDGDLTVENSNYTNRVKISAPGGLAQIEIYGIGETNPAVLASIYDVFIINVQPADGYGTLQHTGVSALSWWNDGVVFHKSASFEEGFTIDTNDMITNLNASMVGGATRGEFLERADGEDITINYRKADGSSGLLTFIDGQLIGHN